LGDRDASNKQKGSNDGGENAFCNHSGII
jgi:hypothetical protein